VETGNPSPVLGIVVGRSWLLWFGVLGDDSRVGDSHGGVSDSHYTTHYPPETEVITHAHNSSATAAGITREHIAVGPELPVVALAGGIGLLFNAVTQRCLANRLLGIDTCGENC